MKSWRKGEKIWSAANGYIHLYPIFIGLGFFVAFLTVCYFWWKQKYSWEILQIILIIVCPSAIIGARLWELIVVGGWSRWYYLSGLSIQGGVVGAFIAVFPYAYSKRKVIDFRTTLGIIIPSILIGQAIGRWGNFANHEVYGGIVSDPDSLNWLPRFIKDNMFIHGKYRQPLFLYESLFNLLGYILIVWVILRKNWLKPGTTAALYLIWYGILRAIINPFRNEDDTLFIKGVAVSWVIALIWIAVGIFFFIWWQFLTRPFDKLSQKIIPQKMQNIFKKEYKSIYPIKPRRKFLFGSKTDYKKKYYFFGPQVENHVKIWIPADKLVTKSKKQINRDFSQRKKTKVKISKKK